MAELTAAEKYAQADVVACWQNLSRQGLQACEQMMVERFLPAAPAGPLLDAGCGAGRAGLALAQAGYRVVGIDLSPAMLQAGRTLSADARLGNADILMLPFADATFGGVLMFFGALQHVPGRRQRGRVLAELARVAQPGGRLVLGLDNLAPALICYTYWFGRKLLPAVRRPDDGSQAGSAADVALWSRESRQVHPLLWHARGLSRTFRWRTWPGLVDLVRQVVPGSAEPGDLRVAQFSLQATPGRTYYHLYRPAELIADAAAANWRLLGHFGGTELGEGRPYPPLIRQADKQQFFAFEKNVL